MKNRSKSETFKKVIKGNKMIIKLNGRIDAKATELEENIKEELDGVEKLVFDFKTVDSITSAGLRVLLTAQKIMNTQGEMKVCNVNETVMEIFDVTGFTDILTIED